jgi:RimJ/RimL family protein N-acetyltransferase
VSLTVLETARLRLRQFTPADAAFVLELLNEPAWLRFIGNRNVYTLDDARAYIANGPRAMFARYGFGLLVAERKADGTALGMCGLIQRDTLPAPDLGYAFLPRHWGQGYAREAAAAMLSHGHQALGLPRILAITAPDNTSSIRLLEELGMRFVEQIPYTDDEVSLVFEHWSEAQAAESIGAA